MATRFLIRENFTPSITPAVDAAWESSAAPFARRAMVHNSAINSSDALTTVAAFTSTAGQDRCHRQTIGPPMAAGNVFNTSVTYKAYAQVLESAANDNIISRIGIRILSEDGATVRATVKAVADYSSGAEWNTALRNKAFLDGDAGTGSYTTVDGDRLCVEWGHNDSAGASISASSRWGSAGTSELPEDETSTLTTARPWFECSLNIAFKARTTVTRYVNTASTTGGDGTTNGTSGTTRAFVSLGDAFTAMRGTDWAANGQAPLLLCSGTAAHTANSSLGTWVGTSELNPFIIRGDAPSSSQWSTTSFRVETSGTPTCINNNGCNHLKLEKVQLKITIPGGAPNRGCFWGSGNPIGWSVLDRCFLWGVLDFDFYFNIGFGADYSCLTGQTHELHCYNCTAVGFTCSGSGSIGFQCGFAAEITTGRFYNNTTYRCDIGYSTPSAASVKPTLKNCGACNSTTGFSGTINASSTNNDSNNSTLAAVMFVDAPNNDLHLTPASPWVFAGADLSSDTAPIGGAITIDGDSVTRVTPWDIGSDEAVISATTVPLTSVARLTGRVLSALILAVGLQNAQIEAHPRVTAQLQTRVAAQSTIRDHGRALASMATRVALQSTVRAQPRITSSLVSRVGFQTTVSGHGYVGSTLTTAAGGVTTAVRYINVASSGGDGTTNATSGASAAYFSWESAIYNEALAGSNLVTRNVVLRFIQMSAGDATGDYGSYANVNFNASPYTTDATHYIIMEGDVSVRHAGVQDTAKAYLQSSSKVIVGEPPNFTHFVGLQFIAGVDNYMIDFQTAPNIYTWYFDKCLFHSTRGSDASFQYAIQLKGTLDGSTDRRIYIRNSVFSGKITRAISLVYPGAAGRLEMHNCTAVGMTEFGILFPGSGSTPLVAKNNVFELQSGAGGVCYYDGGGAAWSSGSNISSDTSSPDSSFRSITLTFTNKSGYDFHLASADTSAIDTGVDTSTEVWPVVDDIAGTARPEGSAYDIGAFEKIAVSGSTVALQSTVSGHSRANADVRTRVALSATASVTPRVVTLARTRVPALSSVEGHGRVTSELRSSLKLSTLVSAHGRITASAKTRVALSSTAFATPLVIALPRTRVAVASLAEGHGRVVATARSGLKLSTSVSGHGRVVSLSGLRLAISSVVSASPRIVALPRVRLVFVSQVEAQPRISSILSTRQALASALRGHPRVTGVATTRTALSSTLRGHPRALASATTRVAVFSTVRAQGRVVSTARTKVELIGSAQGNPRVTSALSLHLVLSSVAYGHPRIGSELTFAGAVIYRAVALAHGYVPSVPLSVWSGGPTPPGTRTEVSIIAT